MKIIFWIATMIVLIINSFLLIGFISVYFSNDGGFSSSSGSIVYELIIGLIVFTVGLILYFLGKTKMATLVMALPTGLVMIYLLFTLILQAILGKGMN